MIVLARDRLCLREWVPDDWLRFKPRVVDSRVVRYIHQQAARASLEYGFRKCKFRRVIAVAQTPNLTSMRVMEKLGMTNA